MRICIGIGLLLLAVIAGAVLFWLSTTALAIFRDEYDEHARSE